MPLFLDEVEHAIVAPVEDGIGVVQDLGIGLAAHVDERLTIAGMEAEEVAGPHGHLVGVHDEADVVHVDQPPLWTEMVEEVDEDPSALHAGLGHLLDAEVAGRRTIRRLRTDHAEAG